MRITPEIKNRSIYSQKNRTKNKRKQIYISLLQAAMKLLSKRIFSGLPRERKNVYFPKDSIKILVDLVKSFPSLSAPYSPPPLVALVGVGDEMIHGESEKGKRG